ncbi:MAG TPA: tetratricopeptide repeat protein [Planctomycetaceae bacterium]|jgi:tetratricopeptide (TPR) repeat protein|nr:tetratricopeptide repeat protein [Planctomycetaceae bacterium]
MPSSFRGLAREFKGTTLARRLVASHGQVRRYRLLLAHLLSNMGSYGVSDPIPWLEEALPLARGLVNEFPDDLEVRHCLVEQECLALARRNAAEHPLVPASQNDVLVAYSSLGSFYRKAKRTEISEKTLEEGLALARQFISAHPDDAAAAEAKVHASLILNKLALIRSQSGRPAQAATLWNEALAFWKQAGEQSPTLVFAWTAKLDTLYGTWIKFLHDTRQDDLAQAAVIDEVNYSVQLAEKHPDSEQARDLVFSSLNRALSEIKTPDERTSLFRQLVESCERALKLLSRKLGPHHPAVLGALQNVAEAYLSAAAHQAWFGRDKEYTRFVDAHSNSPKAQTMPQRSSGRPRRVAFAPAATRRVLPSRSVLHGRPSNSASARACPTFRWPWECANSAMVT